jgi:quinol-cytochrome oxidoreductase complex cytochrome b subunit
VSDPTKIQAELQSDVRKNPRRIAFLTRRTSPHVQALDEPQVMTWPAAMARFIVALEVAFLLLVWVSLVFNAPLEGLADPMHTPNPAKAPWYFLGLQELLHYFPPMVAGVLIPGMVVGALIIIPYFNVNIEAGSIWARKERRGVVMGSTVGFMAVIFLLFARSQFGHGTGAPDPTSRILDLTVPFLPSLLVGGALLWSSRFSPQSPQRYQRWLYSKPIYFWIMTWFLVELIVLTAVGTFFRGPGWSWVWPWSL